MPDTYEITISPPDLEFILLNMDLIDNIKQGNQEQVKTIVEKLNQTKFDAKSTAFNLAMLNLEPKYVNSSFLYAVDHLDEFATDMPSNKLKAYLYYLENNDDKNYEVSEKFVTELQNKTIEEMQKIPTELISNFITRNYQYNFEDLNKKTKTFLTTIFDKTKNEEK